MFAIVMRNLCAGLCVVQVLDIFKNNNTVSGVIFLCLTLNLLLLNRLATREDNDYNVNIITIAMIFFISIISIITDLQFGGLLFVLASILAIHNQKTGKNR